MALHVGIHAAQHGPDDAKALGDLARGLERWPDEVWREATTLAGRLEAVPAFSAGLRRLPEGELLAEQLGLPSAAELDWEIRNREARPRGTFHVRALSEAKGVREPAAILARALFPTPNWMRRRYDWASWSRGRLVLAYLFHLVHAPGMALRARRFVSEARRAGRD